ncbi:MAG: PorV/PorQ family protein [Gemmatimonadota bacterium]|nr:PorV/PorQ family protein [Gemmatimonadota bacterium]
MHTTHIRLLAAAAALAWSSAAHAQSGLPGSEIVPGSDDRVSQVGTRGANFLHVGIGARAEGMAGAVSALIDGPNALFWNPANIASRDNLSVFASYERLFGNSGITDVTAALTLPIGQGALGVGITQYSSGQIERTTENAPEGGDPAFPGTFSWIGTAFSAHYARNVTDRLTAAIGGRYATEGIDVASSSYFAADISTRFRTGLYGLTVGAALSNLGGSGNFNGPGVQQQVSQPRYNGQATGRNIPFNYRTREEPIPTTVQFGVLSSLFGDAEALFGTSTTHALNGEVDFMHANDTDVQAAVGLEYGFRKQLFARIGKRWYNEQHSGEGFSRGFALGGGLHVPFLGRHLALDYAFVNQGQLQHNQVLSFDFGF